MSSCCGGNCGCGSACKCGNGCGGCKMNADLAENYSSPTVSLVSGLAPKTSFVEGGFEMAAENDGCKCGPDCKCNPCTCK